MQQLTLTIQGKVHGVGFRWFVAEHARQLQLVGWVKNNADGTVSLLAQGDTEALQKLLQLCQRGPAFAQVDHIEEMWNPIEKIAYNDFSIQR